MITVEHVDFISIPTRDVARAKRFYGETLGLRSRRTRPPAPSTAPGQVTLGIWAPETRVSSSRQPVRLRAARAGRRRSPPRAGGAGRQFDMETFDTGVCHMALMRDPDGNQIILHRRYAP